MGGKVDDQQHCSCNIPDHRRLYSKYLGKALPDRVFRQISLGDCSPEVAKRFVINHIDFVDSDENPDASEDKDAAKPLASEKRTDLGELDSAIGKLGGRLTEL